MIRRRMGLVLGLCTIGLSLAACTKNEATGKRIFTLGLSRDQEIALGSQAAPEFTEEYGGAISHAGLQEYVAGIGRKMAAETEGKNPTLPWEFTLLNTDSVNAFALPGGKVFFTRGLAERLTSEAQMAGVLGHEIGHVTAQHGAQRIASSQALAAGIGVAAIVVNASDSQRVKEIGGYGVPALAIGGNLVMLKFGRNEELEADRLGVRYMANVGYNPRGQLEVMQVLQQLSQGSSQPAFLSTHPDPAARVQAIQRLLETDYAFTQGSAKHQDFKDRYKSQFLDVIKNVPKPPKPAATGAVDVAHPSMWCLHCAAAEEGVPVPPRKGVYAFFAPAPR